MVLSNQVFLSGRIVQQPTRQNTPHGNGISASMLMAFPTSKQVFKDGKWQAEDAIHHVTVFGQDAEFLLQWGYVGARVQVEGVIKSNFNDNGKMRTRIIAHALDVLSQKADYYEWRKGEYMKELQAKQAQPEPYPQQPVYQQTPNTFQPAPVGNNTAPFQSYGQYQ